MQASIAQLRGCDMGKHSYCFLSSLQIDAIRDMIPEQLTPKREPWGSGDIFKRREEDHIRLGFRLPFMIEGRNSFTPIFYGKLSEHPNGTKIKGSFNTHLGVRIFVWVFASISFIFMAFTLDAVLNNDENIIRLVPPFLMIPFPFALERFGLHFSKDHKTALLQYIESALDATPYDDSHN